MGGGGGDTDLGKSQFTTNREISKTICRCQGPLTLSNLQSARKV
jgi:hypothetical protein